MKTYRDIKEWWNEMKSTLGGWTAWPEAVTLEEALNAVDKTHDEEEISEAAQNALDAFNRMMFLWLARTQKVLSCI
ncbi:MAG: hypothetical protein WBS54_01750 [Acidobacteriota bacterium]